MDDKEKYMDLCARSAELDGEDKVYRTVLELANRRANECFHDRLFMEMRAWKLVAKDMHDKIMKLLDEYDVISEEISKNYPWRA